MISPSRKAKITWQCRRGMLELDLILTRFIDNELDNLSTEQLHAFESLLTTSDPVLYDWLMGRDTPTDKECSLIVAFIKRHDNAG